MYILIYVYLYIQQTTALWKENMILEEVTELKTLSFVFFLYHSNEFYFIIGVADCLFSIQSFIR